MFLFVLRQADRRGGVISSPARRSCSQVTVHKSAAPKPSTEVRLLGPRAHARLAHHTVRVPGVGGTSSDSLARRARAPRDHGRVEWQRVEAAAPRLPADARGPADRWTGPPGNGTVPGIAPGRRGLRMRLPAGARSASPVSERQARRHVPPRAVVRRALADHATPGRQGEAIASGTGSDRREASRTRRARPRRAARPRRSSGTWRCRCKRRQREVARVETPDARCSTAAGPFVVIGPPNLIRSECRRAHVGVERKRREVEAARLRAHRSREHSPPGNRRIPVDPPHLSVRSLGRCHDPPPPVADQRPDRVVAQVCGHDDVRAHRVGVLVHVEAHGARLARLAAVDGGEVPFPSGSSPWSSRSSIR